MPNISLQRLLPLLMAVLACSVDAQQVIRLNIAPGGFSPYTIVTSGKEASGIVPEVLRAVASKTGYVVKTLEIPHNRVERMILGDELDATPRAIEWTANPERFIFTDPLLDVRDVVFSLRRTPVIYTRPADLENKRIGARLGYNYPVLENVFSAGRATRVDVNSERAELVMLDLNRLDAAILNEMVALWILRQEGWQDRYVYSRQAVESAPYRLMFNRKWADFVVQFNRELAAMKMDGRLARIQLKYQPHSAVPQN